MVEIDKVIVTASKQEDYGDRKASVTYEGKLEDGEDEDAVTKALLNKARKHCEERVEDWRERR